MLWPYDFDATATVNATSVRAAAVLRAASLILRSALTSCVDQIDILEFDDLSKYWMVAAVSTMNAAEIMRRQHARSLFSR